MPPKPETVRDLGLELETAYLLFRERSLSVEYEPRAGAKTRAPDFAISYTSSSVFMVEVTRLRALAARKSFRSAGTGAQGSGKPFCANRLGTG
ncbi:hypothetical protein BH24DEI2_BH24DEI2_23920 [soil metagenome]